jgi:putative peptidoglycan binding protein
VRNAAPRHRRAAGDDEAFDRRAAPRPWWWRLLLRHPRDSFALVVAAAAATAIIVNGAYLQHGPHPAPMFAVKPLPVAASEPTGGVGVLPRPRPAELEAARRDPAPVRAHAETADNKARPAAPITIAGPRKDAIAELLATRSVQPSAPPPQRSSAQPSRQVLAAQRALSEFGYGQLKPTGVYDADTRLAIQHFERDHKLPITGELSERVTRELVTLTGHELD